MNWHITWQDLLVMGSVACAGWYLLRRLVGILRRDRVTGCGTCAGCPGDAQRNGASKKAYVPVDVLVDSADEAPGTIPKP